MEGTLELQEFMVAQEPDQSGAHLQIVQLPPRDESQVSCIVSRRRLFQIWCLYLEIGDQVPAVFSFSFNPPNEFTTRGFQSSLFSYFTLDGCLPALPRFNSTPWQRPKVLGWRVLSPDQQEFFVCNQDGPDTAQRDRSRSHLIDGPRGGAQLEDEP